MVGYPSGVSLLLVDRDYKLRRSSVGNRTKLNL